MKLETAVNEIAEIFKGIKERPEQLFEMIRLDLEEVVGEYLTAMMNAELTHFLARAPYVRNAGDVDHRNGSYGRGFTLKGIGESRLMFREIATESSRVLSFPGANSMRKRRPGISAFCFWRGSAPEAFP